jgi:hypothetical protein
MRYALVDLTHADLLDEYPSLDEGQRALEELVRDEPGAGEHVGLVAHDDQGRPVGEPITISLPRL